MPPIVAGLPLALEQVGKIGVLARLFRRAAQAVGRRHLNTMYRRDDRRVGPGEDRVHEPGFANVDRQVA